MRCLMPAVLILCMVGARATAADMPRFVQQYADAYIHAHPDEQARSMRPLADEYARWFLRGFINPRGGMREPSDIDGAAYTEGQAYGRAHPDERAAIFADFGYVPVATTGVWRLGFETMAFRPDDSDEHGWWMRPFGEVSWTDLGLVPPDRKNGAHNFRVHIEGYVSPVGQYGHMGGFPREVVVLSGGPAAE